MQQPSPRTESRDYLCHVRPPPISITLSSVGSQIKFAGVLIVTGRVPFFTPVFSGETEVKPPQSTNIARKLNELTIRVLASFLK